jgi:hypothetical protein
MVDMSMLSRNADEYHLAEIDRGIKYELHGLPPHEVRSVLAHARSMSLQEAEPAEVPGVLIGMICCAISGAIAGYMFHDILMWLL